MLTLKKATFDIKSRVHHSVTCWLWRLVVKLIVKYLDVFAIEIPCNVLWVCECICKTYSRSRKSFCNMDLLMSSPVRDSLKCFPTNRAFVRALSSVDNFVLLSLSWLDKPFPAKLATKGLFSRVNLFMHFSGVRGNKTLATKFTSVSSLSFFFR